MTEQLAERRTVERGGQGSIALVLTGGGARAAYQAGVLVGVRELMAGAGWSRHVLPFRILCGTSAGAINAAAIASHGRHFDRAVRLLAGTWASIDVGQVYRADARGSLLHALRWLTSATFGWLARHAPRSMFDNSPLHELLERTIDQSALHAAIAGGAIDALAITASSYTSGQHVTFYESALQHRPWSRAQRLAAPTTISLAHLVASSAIPFLFPAVRLRIGDRVEFFGDGSMRQNAPLSPAIHLGARRILVIGAGQVEAGRLAPAHSASQLEYPPLAQIASHALSSIFLDALTNDIERARRINRTLSLIPPAQRTASELHYVDVLTISPSRRLDHMAAAHVAELPPAVRALLRVFGATDARSAGLMSYLLFQPGYTRELIALGRADALAQRDAVLDFLGPPPRPSAAGEPVSSTEGRTTEA